MSKQEERYNKRRLKSSYLTSVVSIFLVLFMMGSLGLLIMSSKKISDYVKESFGFEVFMNENVKEADIKQLQKTLDSYDFVKSTDYITKERAAEILEEDLGEEFVSFIGYTLPPSIDVRFIASYANNDSLAVLEKQLLENQNVKEVSYQKSLIHLVNKNLKKIGFIILIVSVLFLMIAIALINNTIRLSVYSKRFLIKTMQLVGATQGFIRKPFVIQGVIQGVISAFIAIGFLIGVLYFFKKNMPELIELHEIDLILTLFGFVIILGILISWLSTWFAVRKYLRIKTDNLYY